MDAEQSERTPNEPIEHLTFVEAAERLGSTPDAVRMRARRGKLATVRLDERTFVLWPQPDRAEHANEQRTERTGSANRSAVQQDERLVAALEARIDSLERQLTERTEESRRKDHIIAGLVQRVPEIGTGQDAPSAAQEFPGPPNPPNVAPDTWWRRWWRWRTE